MSVREALESFLRDVDTNIDGREGWREIFNPRMADTMYSHVENLRAALREMDKAKPVAWQSMHAGIPVSETHNPDEADRWRREGVVVRPLYAAPPAPDAEREKLAKWCDAHADNKQQWIAYANPPAEHPDTTKTVAEVRNYRRISAILRGERNE